jgi:hypothetical protein
MKEMGILILTIIILTLAVLSTLFLSSTGQATTNTTNVYVNVSTTAVLLVDPQSLEWGAVLPGSNGTDITLTIKNGGSTAFSSGVSASVNSFAKETSDPIGSSTASSYASGSFLVLKNASDTNYYFVNRMEWNDSSSLGSIQNKNTTNGASWGFYHNKTQRWVWEICKDSNNQCLNYTGAGSATFKINATEGSYELGGAITSATGVGNTTEWSFWTFPSGPLVSYCVAIKTNCQAFMIYRWDQNSSLSAACTTKTLLNATLPVGSSLPVTANVFLPSGIPSGVATNSTLTITAT